MKCLVPLCNNKNLSRGASSREITFHKFPSIHKIQKAWLQALRIQETCLPQRAVVCSQHFLTEDFSVTRSGLKKLRPGAVPFVVNDKPMDKDKHIKIVKQEPLEPDSVETCCNVYDSLFDVVKNELCQQNGSKFDHLDTKIEHFSSLTLPASNSANLLCMLKDSVATNETSMEIESSLLPWDSIDTAREVKTESSTDCMVQDATREENWMIKNTKCFSDLDVPDVEYELSVSNIESLIKHSHEDNITFNINSNAVTKNNMLNLRKCHTKNAKYVCDVCQIMYKCRQSLVNHIESHKEERFFTCKICPFKSKYAWCLKRHSRLHSYEKSFVCKECCKTFRYKNHLARHMKKHTGNKRFACRLCPFKSIDNFALKQHMRCHTGERPFVCKLCHYQFTQKYNLTRHMLTHTGETPFECDYCHHKCAQKYDLVNHFKTHTEKKMFVCKFCAFECSFNSNLASHMKVHTGEKCFICDVCSLVYSSKHNLLRHMRTHTD